MGWVTGKMWPWIAGAVMVAALVFAGRRNGTLAAKVAQVEGQNDAQARMRQAAANTRTDRGGVVERLRSGRF